MLSSVDSSLLLYIKYIKYLGNVCNEGMDNNLFQREQKASLEIYV